MTKTNKGRNAKKRTPVSSSNTVSTPARPSKKVDEKQTPEKHKGTKARDFPPGDMRAHVNKVTPKNGDDDNDGANDDDGNLEGKDSKSNQDIESISTLGSDLIIDTKSPPNINFQSGGQSSSSSSEDVEIIVTKKSAKARLEEKFNNIMNSDAESSKVEVVEPPNKNDSNETTNNDGDVEMEDVINANLNTEQVDEENINVDVTQKITRTSVKWSLPPDKEITCFRAFNGFQSVRKGKSATSIPIIPVTFTLNLSIEKANARTDEAAKQLNSIIELLDKQVAPDGKKISVAFVPRPTYSSYDDVKTFEKGTTIQQLKKYVDTYNITTKKGRMEKKFFEKTRIPARLRANNRYSVIRNASIQSLLNHGYEMSLHEISQDQTLIGAFYPSFDCLDTELIEQYIWEKHEIIVNVRTIKFENKTVTQASDIIPKSVYTRAYAWKDIRANGSAMGVYCKESNKKPTTMEIIGILEKEFPVRPATDKIETFTIEVMTSFFRIDSACTIHDAHIKTVPVIPAVLWKQYRHSVTPIFEGGGAFQIKLIRDVEALDRIHLFKSAKKKISTRMFIHTLTVPVQLTVNGMKSKLRMRCFDSVKVTPMANNTNSIMVKFTTHFAASEKVSEFVAQKAKKMIDGMGYRIIKEVGMEAASDILAPSILSALARDTDLSTMTFIPEDGNVITIPDDLKNEMSKISSGVDDVDSIHTGVSTKSGGTTVVKKMLVKAQDENEAIRNELDTSKEENDRLREELRKMMELSKLSEAKNTSHDKATSEKPADSMLAGEGP